jgi:hypothetical protein
MIYPQGPQAENERLAAGQASSGRPPRGPDFRSDQRSSGMRTASVHTLHSFGRKGDQGESQPSLVRRMFRTLTRFVVTLLIGIGGTLAWQSYGDVAKEMVAASPALAWLLPPTRWPVSASLSPTQQPTPASSLDALRRSVEQLAFRQDQMVQGLATLQAIEVDIRQKMSFTPPSAVPIPAASQPAAPVPQYKPAQPKARPSAVQ